MLKHIIFPGWAVPCECYETLLPDSIADYGFFKYPENFNTEYIDAPLAKITENESISSLLPEEDILLTAHSLGSLPAIRAASGSDYIKALVLIGGFAKFTSSENYPYGKPEAGINMMQGMMGLSASMVLARFYKEMTRPSDFRVPDKYKTDNSLLKQGLEYLKSCDLRSVLPDIDIPVIIIHGADDAIVDYRLAEYLHEHISNSSLHIIEGAGHALPFTHSEECLKIIQNI